MMPNFKYVKAGSLQEAIERSAAPGARLLAGGTDLLGCLRDGVFPVDIVVSIAGLAELRGIEETPGGGLRIGALTKVAEVAASPLVKRKYPALASAAQEVASPQLRNQGTLGGNLCQKPRCWYYRGDFRCFRKGGDTCFAMDGQSQYHCVFGGRGCFIVHPSDIAPALKALAAEVRAVGPAGSRRIPLERFHVLPADDIRRETWLEPGEVLAEVIIPPPLPGHRSAYRKVRARGSWDFALAGAAVALQVDGAGTARDARVVLSGVAPIPWRSEDAEKSLRGQPIGSAAARRAGEAAAGGAQPLAMNGYKIPLIAGVVQEAIAALA